jgi:hypothetical protein
MPEKKAPGRNHVSRSITRQEFARQVTRALHDFGYTGIAEDYVLRVLERFDRGQRPLNLVEMIVHREIERLRSHGVQVI